MRLFISFFLTAFATATAAQELSLTGEVLQETEHDRTLISKPGWLRGLHIVGSTPVKRDHSLMLAVVPGPWTELCAQFTSIGGDYSAIVQFPPIEAADAPRSAELKVFAGKEVARTSTHANGGVVLESGKCSDDRMPNDDLREYTASFWNVENTPTLDENGFAQLVLNMSVARADRITPTALIDKDPMQVECEKLESPKALAFNYQCTISIPPEELAARKALKVNFKYERFYRGRVAPQREALIYVGALTDIDLGESK